MFAYCIPGFPLPQTFPLNIHPATVTFAGSRNGFLPASAVATIIHCFFAVGSSFITGCAPGIDACFRSVLAASPFTHQSLVACAFTYRARRLAAARLRASLVVPGNLSAAATGISRIPHHSFFPVRYRSRFPCHSSRRYLQCIALCNQLSASNLLTVNSTVTSPALTPVFLMQPSPSCFPLPSPAPLLSTDLPT